MSKVQKTADLIILIVLIAAAGVWLVGSGKLNNLFNKTTVMNVVAKSSSTQETTNPASTKEMTKQNEPLITTIYTADPSAHVFNGKIYIYPSHDLDHDVALNGNGDQYDMEDYHILSMDDLYSPCVDNGQALHVKDVPWASKQMWAPDAAFKNNTYFMYFPAKDKEGIFRIGVATSQNPVGPFKAQDNYIPGSFSIDPAVFMDEDNKVYMYFGGLWGGQLEMWQTGTYNPEPSAIDIFAPALGPMVAEMSDDMLSFKSKPQQVLIVDENGKPIMAGDEDRRYFEAPWMHKYNGYYYLSYSTGSTHRLVYAMSKSPKGPFVFKGKILEPVLGWTTHHSIVEIQGKWYLFYHDASLSGGIDNKRCIKYTELHYNPDGTIETILPYENK